MQLYPQCAEEEPIKGNGPAFQNIGCDVDPLDDPRREMDEFCKLRLADKELNAMLAVTI